MKAEDSLLAKYEQLARKIQDIESRSEPQRQYISEEYCSNCGMPGHTSYSCPNTSVFQEQSPMEVNAMNGPCGLNSYGNTYKPNTR